MTCGTPQKHQKNPNGTKPMLINMIKAVPLEAEQETQLLSREPKNSHH